MKALVHSNSFKLLESPTDETLQDWCSLFRERIQKLSSPNPHVSVIVPAFNEEMYLPVMLDALSRLQTTQQVEFIGVNNASTDRTSEIFKESGIICVDEPKKGVSYARQAGLMEAKWDYIFTTDADAIMPIGWIDSNLQYFNDCSDLVCFSGGSIPKGAHWSYYAVRATTRSIRSILWKKGESLMSFPWHNSVFKKEVALSIWGYEPGTDLSEDNILARKMRPHGKILRISHDPSIQVATSARRIETLSRVADIIQSRLQLGWLDYNKQISGLTFTDVR